MLEHSRKKFLLNTSFPDLHHAEECMKNAQLKNAQLQLEGSSTSDWDLREAIRNLQYVVKKLQGIVDETEPSI